MRFRSAKQRKAVMAKLRGMKVKYGKLPKTVKPSDYQIGKTHLKQDRMLRALKPGKRVSKAGQTYYEHRRDHSDLHPAKHL
jgi:hypothetical protein